MQESYLEVLFGQKIAVIQFYFVLINAVLNYNVRFGIINGI